MKRNYGGEYSGTFSTQTSQMARYLCVL